MLPASHTSQSLPTSERSLRQHIQRWVRTHYKRYLVAGACLSLTSIATGLEIGLVRLWDAEMQTLFFELRGPVEAPSDIVVLAIDDESLDLGPQYTADPESLPPELALMQSWPWQRRAYAIAIERLIKAGAKAVALDITFATPSLYGAADDEALAQVLQTYGEQVVIATPYEQTEMNQGSVTQLTLPLPQYQATPIHLGVINFPLEPDGRIHQMSEGLIEDLNAAQVLNSPEAQASVSPEPILSFAEATLLAAKEGFPPLEDSYIHFYGPHKTFTHIPFWYVLDADPWQKQLHSGAAFKDKIVLIGSTAAIHQDWHRAAFPGRGKYPNTSGVEILANSIATLRAGNAIGLWPRSVIWRVVLVVVVGLSFTEILGYLKKPLWQLTATGIAIAVWFGVGYGSFVIGGVFLPTAVPMVTMGMIGSAIGFASLISDQLRKQRLREALAQYATSPIVQEIISQQDDLQDLLQMRAAVVMGEVLRDRYRIIKLLGAGGFGETYIAEDMLRPGHPSCVVKQLKILSNDPKTHQLARRLFTSEAETLETLGQHEQIPRLLAYFEINQGFYLVQEMIEGHLLKDELASRLPHSQADVLAMLKDLLATIDFVHSHNVIHRDIKPSNIIRRHADGKLVLIDFGAVKHISNQLTDTSVKVTSTIGIGTQGYMPSEQSAGLPNFSSDLYALGVTAIEALTGSPPHALDYSSRGELIWMHKVPDLDPAFAAILDKMVRYDFSQRYQAATDVLADLHSLGIDTSPNVQAVSGRVTPLGGVPDQPDEIDDPDTDTLLSDTPAFGAPAKATQLLPQDWSNTDAPSDNGDDQTPER